MPRSFRYIFSWRYWATYSAVVGWIYRLWLPGVLGVLAGVLAWHGCAMEIPNTWVVNDGYLWLLFGEPVNGDWERWFAITPEYLFVWSVTAVAGYWMMPMMVVALGDLTNRRRHFWKLHCKEDAGDRFRLVLRILWGNAYVSEFVSCAMDEGRRLASTYQSRLIGQVMLAWMYVALLLVWPVVWGIKLAFAQNEAVDLGRDAWGVALVGDFEQAVELAERGLAVDEEELFIAVNLATGLLFTGREREAVAVIFENADKGLGRSWFSGEERLFGDVYVKDIEALRSAGHDHPLFDVILEELQRREKKDG